MSQEIRPLPPSRATEAIRAKAKDPSFKIQWTDHAKQQMSDRGLLMSDAIFVLKNGFIYQEAEPATQKGFFKYAMQSPTPNSGGRAVRTVVIPSMTSCVKIVTVMFVDEKRAKGV